MLFNRNFAPFRILGRNVDTSQYTREQTEVKQWVSEDESAPKKAKGGGLSVNKVNAPVW